MDFIDFSHIPFDELKKYISNGYRYVSYQTDYLSKDGYIYALMFDKNKKPLNFKYKYPAKTYYVIEGKSNIQDIYGRNLTTKIFKNAQERNTWIESNKEFITIVHNPPVAQDFLTNLFWNETEQLDYNQQPLRIHFIDIETEISDSFEYPSTARNRINLITIFDNLTNKYYTWSLEKVKSAAIKKLQETITSSDIQVFEFDDDEEKMLMHYLNWHQTNYPDVFSGWNIRSFDIPYILRRFENLFGKQTTNKYSPLNKYYIFDYGLENPNNTESQRIEIKLHGISQLDLLILYRDKFGIKPALSGGYSLGNVGEAEDLGDKLEFEGSLKNLYLQDWDKFYRYNVRDVHLTVLLENKLKLIPLARQLVGYSCAAEYEKCYGSISYIIGSLHIFALAHSNKVIFPTYSPKLDADINVHFEGAYVFDSVPGIYTKGIAAVDAASLYPSVIRASNISPETYIGKISGKSLAVENDEDEITIQLQNGSVKKITKKQFDLLLKEKLIFTKNNTLFTKPSIKHGIIPKWCEHYFAIRSTAKKQEIIERNKGNLDLAEFWHAKNIGMKLMLNSVYGIMGSKYCPFFNTDFSQSVTRQGKFCNQESAKFVEQKFREEYGIAIDYRAIIQGDTDSIFFSTILSLKGEI